MCCPSSLEDPLSVDGTPSSLFHLKFQRCFQAAQWQHISIPALKPSKHKENLLTNWQAGLSLHSSWRSLLWFQSFWKLFFSFYIVIGRGETLSKRERKVLAFVVGILFGRNTLTVWKSCLLLHYSSLAFVLICQISYKKTTLQSIRSVLSAFHFVFCSVFQQPKAKVYVIFCKLILCRGRMGNLDASMPQRCEGGPAFPCSRASCCGIENEGWRLCSGGCGQRGRGLIMFATGQASPWSGRQW